MEIVIYGPTEPGQPWNVRYIGQTRRRDGQSAEQGMRRRLMLHWAEAKYRTRQTPKLCWLSELREQGRRPGLILFDIGKEDTADRLEDFYIASHRTAGFNLVNCDGVHRGTGYWLGKKHTPESKAKMSAAHVGKKYFLGKKHTPESRAKMSSAKKGKLRNINYCLKGHEYTPLNTYVDREGHRKCKMCNRLSYLARRRLDTF